MEFKKKKSLTLEVEGWLTTDWNDHPSGKTFYQTEIDGESFDEFLYDNLENRKKYRITFELLDGDES